VCVLECDFQLEEAFCCYFCVFLNFWLKCDVAGGREVFFSPTRLSFFSTIYEEGETLHKDFGKTFAFSPSALEAPQRDLLQGGEVTKVFTTLILNRCGKTSKP
jgi:hypothetical protein